MGPSFTILVEKYLNNNLSAEEERELIMLSNDPENIQQLEAMIGQHLEDKVFEQESKSELRELIYSRINEKLGAAKITRMPVWKKWAVAASIVLVVGLGSYLMFFRESSIVNREPVERTALTNDVKAPETNRAMITLADGRKVYLDSIDNGQLALQNNVKLIKAEDGKISYEGVSTSVSVAYNTLTNPRGSKVIDMTLADGSRVWLNAGSSVTYPVAFIGNERKVEITGEAYFEVAPSNSPTGGGLRPFIVSKGTMQVQVLGTHFNVNAYDDEANIKVTLLEGSVKVNNGGQSDLLKPGQQARVTNIISVIDGVDTDEVMAWKNGTFYFNNTNIETIMRQASRWYDVDIVYEGNVRNEFFGGTVPRNENISQLIKALELTQTIKITVEGRKIIIRSAK